MVHQTVQLQSLQLRHSLEQLEQVQLKSFLHLKQKTEQQVQLVQQTIKVER